MSFNLALVGSAVVFALVALPGAASAGPLGTNDGFVYAAGTTAWVGFDGTAPYGTPHGLTLEGQATGQWDLGSGFGVQADLLGASRNYEYDGSSLDTLDRSVDLAVHGFMREQGQYLAGGFLQAGIDAFDDNAQPRTNTLTRLYGGLEGQLLFGDMTLYAQAGFQKRSGSNLDGTGWLGNAEAGYFLSPNWKIEAHGGYNRLNADAGGGTTVWKAGAGVEYKLDGEALSVFAKYDYIDEASDGAAYSTHSNRILVGLRLNFDAPGTLRQRDEGGASLSPVHQDNILYQGPMPPP